MFEIVRIVSMVVLIVAVVASAAMVARLVRIAARFEKRLSPSLPNTETPEGGDSLG